MFTSEELLLQVTEKLNNYQIYPRRYFYPSLNKIEYTNGSEMPVSESIAERIMCLPLYLGLKQKDLKKMVNLINANL
jgi:dTDP-4-amino-4,6-dideoxygalactose transaminase